MQCYGCDFYRSGQISNKCVLTNCENFRSIMGDSHCDWVDDDYIFTDDCEPMGFVKDKNAKEFVERRIKW